MCSERVLALRAGWQRTQLWEQLIKRVQRQSCEVAACVQLERLEASAACCCW